MVTIRSIKKRSIKQKTNYQSNTNLSASLLHDSFSPIHLRF